MKVVGLVILCILVLLLTLAITQWPWIVNNMRYSDFTISGTVVDEHGNPLDGVGVAVTTGRRIKTGFESDSHTTFDRIDKTFEYKFRNYSNIDLWFFKTGYEEQRLSWGTGGRYSGVIVVMKRGHGAASRPVKPVRHLDTLVPVAVPATQP